VPQYLIHLFEKELSIGEAIVYSMSMACRIQDHSGRYSEHPVTLSQFRRTSGVNIQYRNIATACLHYTLKSWRL